MQVQNAVPDTFTLSGDYEDRVAQMLRITQDQARVAQTAARAHMQDALTGLKDACPISLPRWSMPQRTTGRMPRRQARPSENVGHRAR
jgi:hypothetical protein